jgi:hypothetical protein
MCALLTQLKDGLINKKASALKLLRASAGANHNPVGEKPCVGAHISHISFPSQSFMGKQAKVEPHTRV